MKQDNYNFFLDSLRENLMTHASIKPFALTLIALIQLIDSIYNRLCIMIKCFTTVIQIDSSM